MHRRLSAKQTGIYDDKLIPGLKRLADAIRQAVSDVGMQGKASALGEKIRHEDGIANAVAVIEQMGEPARRSMA